MTTFELDPEKTIAVVHAFAILQESISDACGSLAAFLEADSVEGLAVRLAQVAGQVRELPEGPGQESTAQLLECFGTYLADTERISKI